MKSSRRFSLSTTEAALNFPKRCRPAKIRRNPARIAVTDSLPGMSLHLEFIPQNMRTTARGYTRERKEEILAKRDAASQRQTEDIVDLIRGHQPDDRRRSLGN